MKKLFKEKLAGCKTIRELADLIQDVNYEKLNVADKSAVTRKGKALGKAIGWTFENVKDAPADPGHYSTKNGQRTFVLSKKIVGYRKM